MVYPISSCAAALKSTIVLLGGLSLFLAGCQQIQPHSDLDRVVLVDQDLGVVKVKKDTRTSKSLSPYPFDNYRVVSIDQIAETQQTKDVAFERDNRTTKRYPYPFRSRTEGKVQVEWKRGREASFEKDNRTTKRYPYPFRSHVRATSS
jgi:hypothetical protein